MLRVLSRILLISLLFFAYLFSGRGARTGHHFFVPLAESFWQGRVYVTEMEGALHEMVSQEEVDTGIPEEPRDGPGKFYVIYPPLPAVVLMPFVAFWGSGTNQSAVSALIAALSVYVAGMVFRELGLSTKKVMWMSILYGFGSMLWYHAVVGSAWYFAHVCALFFLWLAILSALRKYSLFLTGLFLGLAFLARFPVLLSLPFFVYVRRSDFVSSLKIHWKNLVLFGAGAGLCVGLLGVYNWVRYGRIDNYGYYLLEHRTYNLENEYAHGSYDLSYIPRHVEAMFLTLPDRSDSFPYLVPDMWSMALWFVFPALVLAVFAPWNNAVVRASALAILFTLPASLFHGGVGASQFGYRYALDYMPFIVLIIAESMRRKLAFIHIFLILFSVLINMWGIYSIFWVK